MRRIMIIGGNATGKSTLARVVGDRLGLPVVHLDRHYWSPGWVKPEAAEWRRRVEQLAAGDAWVMEGNYSSTFDLRLPRAHALVWLDLPRWIYFPRAVRRLIVNYGRERADIGPGCPERLDLDFLLRWVWTYPTRSRPGSLKLVEDIAGTKRVVVLRKPREVVAFAAGLPASLIPGRQHVYSNTSPVPRLPIHPDSGPFHDLPCTENECQEQTYCDCGSPSVIG